MNGFYVAAFVGPKPEAPGANATQPLTLISAAQNAKKRFYMQTCESPTERQGRRPNRNGKSSPGWRQRRSFFLVTTVLWASIRRTTFCS